MRLSAKPMPQPQNDRLKIAPELREQGKKRKKMEDPIAAATGLHSVYKTKQNKKLIIKLTNLQYVCTKLGFRRQNWQFFFTCMLDDFDPKCTKTLIL